MKLKDNYKLIKPSQFYVVHMWMQTNLHLTGIKLHTYAVIYGFTQAAGSVYNGSLDFISEMTGYSKQKICSCLKELVEDNLIYKKVLKNKPQYYCNLDMINLGLM